jgi:hypothetical protein
MKTGFRRRVSFKTFAGRRITWKFNFPSHMTTLRFSVPPNRKGLNGHVLYYYG